MSEQEREGASTSRRGFLGASIAGLAALALTPGVRLIEIGNARPADQPVTNAHRWGMLIDTDKCAKGCSACVTACNVENGIVQTNRPHTDAQWIRKVEIKDKRSGEARAFPVMCQHCEHPPCVDVCPTGASFKRADGIVLVDKHICIGCRYCMMACPYKARSFIHEPLAEQKAYAPRGKGCVESCTLCVHRIDEGGKPACAEACAAEGHDALLFGDLNDPASELAKRVKTYATTQLRADLKLNTGVRYQGL